MHKFARGIARASISTTHTARSTTSSWRITAATALASASRRRNHHVRVPLPYKIEDGMGDFLSPSALKIIAEDYQQGLLDRLNEQIKRCAYFSLGLGNLLIAILRAGQARGLKIKASRRLSFQPQRTRAKRSPSTTRAWRSTTHFSCIISYYHVLRVSKVLGVSKYKFLRYF